MQAPDASVIADYGWSVAMETTVAVVSAIRGGNNFEGEVYVYGFDGTTWNIEDQLFSPNPVPFSLFGESVGLSGNTIVVGESYVDFFNGSTGVAYVYQKDGAVWGSGTPLLPPPGELQVNDQYGYSVSISTDVIVVSARKSNTVGFRAGAAYIFRRDAAGVWNFEQKITASDAAVNDEFGTAVSTNGSTIAIGAPFHDTGGFARAGKVYVFTFDGSTWSETTPLTATIPTAFDKFGFSLSLDGSVCIVGSPNDDGLNAGTGAAYIFRDLGPGLGFAFEDKIFAADGVSSSLAGKSVSLSGDIAILGDPSGQGKAYVFSRDPSTSTWSEKVILDASGDHSALNFAQSVTSAGGQVFVGADKFLEMNVSIGSAYFFDGFVDCDGNGVHDTCDPKLPDRNQNGIPDCREIAEGTLADCNGNGVADGYEVDDYWNPVASFLDSRFTFSGIHHAAASLINGKIYVSHGVRPDSTNPNVEPVKRSLSIYDIASDSWTHGGVNAPDAPSERRDLGGATAIGKHYAIGGVDPIDPGGSGAVSDMVYEFTPTTNTWDTKNPMPTARAGIGCASWNNFIYVVGGRTGTDFGEGTILGTLERFDPVLNVWTTTLPDMPLPVSDCSATIAIDGKIYVFGGATGPVATTDAVQVFDTAIGTWISSNDPPGIPDPPVKMPLSHGAAMAGIFNGKIVVFGGRNSTFFHMASVFIYDPVQNTWDDGSNLVDGAHGMAQGATWDASGIYSIGKKVFSSGIPEIIVQKLIMAEPDCNNNGNPDSCDQVNNDCDGNGIPDECDPDCNGNGIPDFCDIVSGLAIDCNFNGIPDRCEVKQCRADITPLCPPQPSTPDVNIDDLVAVLNAFGPCVGCPEDFMPKDDLPVGDGLVDIDELVDVLNNFGPCAPGGSGATAITLVQMDFSSGYVLADGSVDAASASLVASAWANTSAIWDVYRLFAQVSGPSAFLSYCGGSTTGGSGGTPEPLVLNPGKGGQFYIPIAGSYAPPNLAMLAIDGGNGFEFQLPAFGTYIALGEAFGAGPSKMGDTAALDNILTTFVNDPNTGWGVYGAVAGQGVVSDGNGGWRVLIGQFAVPKGKTFTAAVRLAGDGIDVYATVNSGVMTLP